MSASAKRFQRLLFELRFAAGFGLAVAILLAAGVFEYRTIQSLIETDRMVARADQVQAELQGTVSAVGSMESAARGYVATGDNSFVSQAQAWGSNAQEHLHRLRVLAVDNSRQQRSLDRLEPLVERKLAFVHQLIALRRQRGLAAATDLLAHGPGQSLMSAIRAQIAAMEADETSLLAARQAASHAGISRAAQNTVLGSLLALVLVALAGWRIRIDIAARTQAELALIRAGAYNRSLIEASLDPLVTIAPNGKISDVNAATEKVTGASRRELVGTDFAGYFTEPETARAGYQQVFREGDVHDYELEIRHRDGHSTPVLYNASVYRDDSGQAVGVFAAARDITERKRAEETRAHLAAIVESSDDAIVANTLDGIVESWNAGAERLYGYSAREAVGRPMAMLLSPDRPDELSRILEKITRGERVAHYETERLRKDGRLVPVAVSVSPIRDAKGEIIGASSITRDISERRRAEEAVRRAGAYNRSLIESGVDPLVTISPDGKITDVNNATEKMTGRSREELIGTDFSDYFTEPERAGAGYRQVFREGVVKDYELNIRHRDGRLTPVFYNASLYRDEKGEIVGVIAAARDITERKRAELEIRQLNDELEQRVALRTAALEAANKELEGFTYSVSHDLRAPLRHIDGFSKLLQEEHSQELSAEAREYIAIVRESVLQMGKLIDDLLNLGRVGRQELNVEVTGLNPLVEGVVADLRLANPARDIEWKIQALPFVECDPPLMKQVFVNLLSNAVKFTRTRKHALIEVGTCGKKGQTVIYVRDNGVGFSMKYVEKLFGIFQRLHRAEDFEGTGIGLATVQRIIRKHGGRVWAEAELNEGATFFLALTGNGRPASETVPESEPGGRIKAA